MDSATLAVQLSPAAAPAAGSTPRPASGHDPALEFDAALAALLGGVLPLPAPAPIAAGGNALPPTGDGLPPAGVVPPPQASRASAEPHVPQPSPGATGAPGPPADGAPDAAAAAVPPAKVVPPPFDLLALLQEATDAPVRPTGPERPPGHARPQAVAVPVPPVPVPGPATSASPVATIAADPETRVPAAAILQELAVAKDAGSTTDRPTPASRTAAQPAAAASGASDAGTTLPVTAPSGSDGTSTTTSHGHDGTAAAAFDVPADKPASPDAAIAAPTDRPGATAPTDRTRTAAPQEASLGQETVGTPRWQQELGHRLVAFAEQGVREVRLHLHPEHLGPLEVRLTLQDSQVGLWLSAGNPETRDALQNSLPRLREMFAQSGFTMTDASIAHQQSGRGQQSHTMAGSPVADRVATRASDLVEPGNSPPRVGQPRLIDEYA